MIYRPEISACDKCGACCTIAPCLLADKADIEKLAKHLDLPVPKFMGKYLQVEKRDRGWNVRLKRGKDGACVFLKNKLCTVQAAKPSGGRSFKCWDLKTFELDYAWTNEAIKTIGVQA